MPVPILLEKQSIKNLNFHNPAVPTGQFILKVSQKNRIVPGASSAFLKKNLFFRIVRSVLKCAVELIT